MKRILPIVLLVLAAPSPPESEYIAQSRADLLALPPGEAAEALLRIVAPRFVTAAGDPEGRSNSLRIVYFGTAPESAGLRGLCQAQMLHMVLERSRNAAAPPIVRNFGLTDVYKVVGDGPDGRLDSREAARLCDAAGPVLAGPDDRHGARFFGYHGQGLPVWQAVAALAGAIRTARDGRYGPIECTRRAMHDCGNPETELAALDLRDLRYLQVVQPDPEQPNFHLRASFVAEPNEGFPSGRRLWLMVNGEPLPGTRVRRDTFNYGRTQLNRG